MLFKALTSTGIVLTLSAGVARAAALTGTYDENATQANTIEGSAAFTASTGDATAANVTTAAAFDPAVEAAFTAGNGGVLTFDATFNADDQVPTTGITGPITATFDGGTKSVDIGYSLGDGGNLFRQGNLSNRTPISANNGSTPGFAATTQDETPGSLTLTFSGVTGGDAGEAVTQAGFTFLSRTSRNYGVVSAVATFSDGSTATSAFTNTAFTAGAEDTFFGFIAPTGASIDSITLTPGSDIGFSIDDIGVITGVPVIPEPASIGLLAGGLLAILPRRRR